MDQPGNQYCEIQSQRPAHAGMQRWRLLEVSLDYELYGKNGQDKMYDSHRHHLATKKFPGLLDTFGCQPVVAIWYLHGEPGALFRPARCVDKYADQQ